MPQTRAQIAQGTTTEPDVQTNIGMLQPSIIQAEEQEEGGLEAYIAANAPLELVGEETTEDLAQETMTGLSLQANNQDGAEGRSTRSKYSLPEVMYIDNGLEIDWKDRMYMNRSREPTFEEVCPQNKEMNLDILARLIWDTKVEIKRDMSQFQELITEWQGKATERILNVESNQRVLCGVIKDIEASQTEISDTSTNTQTDVTKMREEHNKMVAAVNNMQNEFARLKLESNIHQRNWNEFNLRIFNVRAPVRVMAASRSGREDTVDLIADLIATNKLLPNHDKEQVKTKITAAFRVGAIKEGKTRGVLVKFSCIRSRNIIFQRAVYRQKEARKRATDEVSKNELKKQVYITEDMTPMDLKERDMLKPLIDGMRKNDKQAYYTKGKVIVSKEGRVKKEVINEFLTKNQLRPIHFAAETDLSVMDTDRSRFRNVSAPSIGAAFGAAKSYASALSYNSYAPLFTDHAPLQPKEKRLGRGRGRGRGNTGGDENIERRPSRARNNNNGKKP